MLGRTLLAEFAGTFALVLIGCGAIMVNELTGALGHLGISLAFGLVIAAMIYATGHVSGAHFNPAVTLALVAIRRFPLHRAGAYITAQLAGAVTAAVLLRLGFGPVAQLGATHVNPIIAWPTALGIEVLLSAMLVFVIVGVTSRGASPGAAGAAIGATVALAALVGGPLTGAGLNPARSIGPALASGDPASLAIVPLYIVGPIAGALLGAVAAASANAAPPRKAVAKEVPA